MRTLSRKSWKRKISKIVVVDDHPVVLRGLSELLEEAEDLKVCGQAERAEDVLALVDQSRPDLVVIDLFLHGILAYDVIKALREKFPKTAILVLSVQKEAHFAERALRAGADGYIIKEEASFEILNGVRALLNGKMYLSDVVQAHMVHRVEDAEDRNLRTFICKLSDRELQVFHLLGEGSFPRQIAAELGANLKTIETYYGRIKKKLNAKSGADLTRLAIQWRSQSSSSR